MFHRKEFAIFQMKSRGQTRANRRSQDDSLAGDRLRLI